MPALSLLASAILGPACGPDSTRSGSDAPPIDTASDTPSSPADAFDTTAPDPACEGPREATSSRSGSILGGTSRWNDEVLPLTPAQALAVGGVFTEEELSCTGTLIAPRIVLTAAHCLVPGPGRVYRPAQVAFAVGADLATPRHTFNVSAVHVHPSYRYDSSDAKYDVAVLVLIDDAVATLGDDIAPIPVNCEPIPRQGFVGARLQVVGYGATDRWGNVFGTRQLWAVETIVDLSAFDFEVYGNGTSGVCYGDSGGPALFILEDTIEVLGVLSYGDAICGYTDYFTRTDTYCAFITQYLPTCDALAARGTCSGSTARYCRSGTLVEDDCSARGQQCLVDTSGDARCAPVADPCQGETFSGRCDGARVVWCEAATIQSRDCGACEKTCGPDPVDGIVDCR